MIETQNSTDLINRSEYFKSFPKRPWLDKHKIALEETYPVATNSELEEEPTHDGRKRHMVGSSFGRPDGRQAGTFNNPHDEVVHEAESEQLKDLMGDHAEANRESRPLTEFTDVYKGVKKGLPDIATDEKAKSIAGKDGAKHVWNIREIKSIETDYKFTNPIRHSFARFVIRATEDALKSQPGAVEKKPEDETKGEEDEQPKGRESDEKVDEEEDGKKEEKEEEKLTKKEAAFLDQVLEELNHLANVENNDGKGHSPFYNAIKKHGFDPENPDREMRIAEEDQFTPDNWIPRSQSLIRLTGSCPLNAEPDLTALFEAGFITPTRLHYVRSHGEVPRLTWETHTLEVGGFVNHPKDFTMEEIASMPWINIPVTLACDGNRRKEVNMIKRSSGFDWGPGATSCVYWKGVLVRDILLACGVKEKPHNERWYVHYEGADNPSEGKYSTQLPFDYAIDPTNDVMLAYEMNDQPLHPDHGYPIRSIIPGYVGGRSVKWLKRLWVSKEPNMSWYHLYDNRILPSFVTDKNSAIACEVRPSISVLALLNDITAAFYHLESTAANEQILQSVICKPAHAEKMPLSPGAPGYKDTYRVAGYAFNGSGHPVKKVELSLDGGKSWRYCFRQFPDKPLRHEKKYWAWIFWFCDVEIHELANASELAVRAFDANLAPQPEHITASWNLSGMLNNAIYRLKPEVQTPRHFSDEPAKEPYLTFLHPTSVVKDAPRGWMEPDSESEEKNDVHAGGHGYREFTLDEVMKHNKEDDAWLIMDNRVYDVTSVIKWHPGGKNPLLMYAGKATAEAAEQYKSIHDDYANKQRDGVFIGVLSKKAAETMAKDAERTKQLRKQDEERRAKYALKKHQWTPITLIEKKSISEDTHIFKFQLPGGSGARLGLPVCQHVYLGLHFSDRMVARPYTPIKPVLPEEEDGAVTFLIKTYAPNVGPFKPGGTASNWIDCIDIGEQAVDIKGPAGEIEYLGKGKFSIEGEEYHFNQVNLLTGGSGVTPDWQLIHAVLQDENDPTKVSLISSNKSREDTLLFNDLVDLEKKHPDRLKVWFTSDVKETNWKYSVGHCTEDVMREHFYGAEHGKTATFLCGPPGLMKACTGGLEKMGFENGKTLFGF